jgi:hypothetical protein
MPPESPSWPRRTMRRAKDAAAPTADASIEEHGAATISSAASLPLLCNVRVEQIENNSHPKQNIPTSHRGPTCQARPTQNGTTKDERTKKSRDLKCFCQKHKFFLTYPVFTHPRVPTPTRSSIPLGLPVSFLLPVSRPPSLPCPLSP